MHRAKVKHHCIDLHPMAQQYTQTFEMQRYQRSS
jgi:hypothetical protein